MITSSFWLGMLCFLLLAAPARSADHPGKSVFEETCKQCHAQKGKGRVYGRGPHKVTVPDLRSEYVQSKPDSELIKIITGGRREMPPVRMGKPKMKHQLSPNQVDDVIAYLRLLGK